MGEAETAALREALRYFVEDIFAGPCRFDHDGYCQEHNVDKPCVVAESRRLLAATEAVREPALREPEAALEKAVARYLGYQYPRGTGHPADHAAHELKAALDAALREHEGRDAEVAGLDALRTAMGTLGNEAFTVLTGLRAAGFDIVRLASTDKPDPAS